MKKHHHNFFYYSVRTLNSILHLRKICVRIIHTVSFSVFQETDRARHRAGLLQSRPPVKQHRIELKNQNRRRGSAAYSLTGKRIFFSEHKKKRLTTDRRIPILTASAIYRKRRIYDISDRIEKHCNPQLNYRSYRKSLKEKRTA